MMKIYSVLFILFLICAAFGQNIFKILISRSEPVFAPPHRVTETSQLKLRNSASAGFQKTKIPKPGNLKIQTRKSKIHFASVANDKQSAESGIAKLETGQTGGSNIVFPYTTNTIREKELENNILTAKRWNSLLFVLSSLLVVFILLLLYSLSLLSKNKKKIELQKQSIFAKNAVLKRNVQEKEFLVRELNHRVKNNLAVILSLIGFQKDETQNVLYKHKIEQLYLRINTIALGHNLFSYNMNSFEKSTVEIKEYSEKIFESHIAGFPKELQVQNDLQEILLPVDKGLSYGLLLNELVTNSLKHAAPAQGQPLKISLNVQESNGVAHMKYCDNGVFFGINDGSNSLGHYIIDAMVQQLDGTFEREDSCYRIVFSVDAKASPQAEKIISLKR